MSSTAVVHTIGTLFPNTSYKDAIRRGDIAGVIGSALSGGKGNPLDERTQKSGYEGLNRDSGGFCLLSL